MQNRDWNEQIYEILRSYDGKSVDVTEAGERIEGIIDSLLTIERQASELTGQVKMIVDLYKIRAGYHMPNRLGEPQDLENLHQYNFFNSVIAQLCTEYNIPTEAIKEEIRRRGFEDSLRDLAARKGELN